MSVFDFNRGLDLLEVPEIRLTKTLDTVLGEIIREAARRWLRKFILHVPAETGMARGTLRPLGQFLRLAVPIRPTRKPYYSKLEGGIQSIESGEAANDFTITDTNFVYEFQWSTSILHYYYSKFYNGSAPSGEEVRDDIAEPAFRNYINATLAKRTAKSLEGLIQIREL